MSTFLDRPRSQHYDFVHRFLRDKAFGTPATLVRDLTESEADEYLLFFWESNVASRGIENDEYISSDGLKCVGFELEDLSKKGVIIQFPEPRGPAEAYFVAIVVPIAALPGEQCAHRFITLECSPKRPNGTILAEWRDGGHFNYGAGPTPDLFEFHKAIEELLRPKGYKSRFIIEPKRVQ